MFYVTPCAVSPTCTVALVIPRLRTNDLYYSVLGRRATSLLADADRPAAIHYNHNSQYFLESSLYCSVGFVYLCFFQRMLSAGPVAKLQPCAASLICIAAN